MVGVGARSARKPLYVWTDPLSYKTTQDLEWLESELMRLDVSTLAKLRAMDLDRLQERSHARAVDTCATFWASGYGRFVCNCGVGAGVQELKAQESVCLGAVGDHLRLNDRPLPDRCILERSGATAVTACASILARSRVKRI